MTALEHPGRWLVEGTVALRAALDRCRDDDLDGPSGLPGWDRRHVLAHLASNAQALGRLATWASTGIEHRMYDSVEQRAAEIAQGAVLPAGELRQWVRRSADDLDRTLAALTPDAWTAEVVTIQGRTIPAREIPWLRAREVWIHLVDLDNGTTFHDVPSDFCVAVTADVAAWRRRTSPAPLRLVTPAGGYDLGDAVDTVVELAVAPAAAWLTGRTHPSNLPDLTPWI